VNQWIEHGLPLVWFHDYAEETVIREAGSVPSWVDPRRKLLWYRCIRESAVLTDGQEQCTTRACLKVCQKSRFALQKSDSHESTVTISQRPWKRRLQTAGQHLFVHRSAPPVYKRRPAEGLSFVLPFPGYSPFGTADTQSPRSALQTALHSHPHKGSTSSLLRHIRQKETHPIGKKPVPETNTSNQRSISA
jgi:hypothetical protein